MPRNEDRRIASVIGRSLIAAEALAAEVRAVLAQRLADDYGARTAGDLTETVRHVLAEIEPQIAALLADAQLAAWILGIDAAAGLLPAATIERLVLSDPERIGGSLIAPTSGPFASDIVTYPAAEAALKDLAKRRVVTRREFDQMSEAARSGAFTIARQNMTEAVEQIHQSLVETLREGPSKRDFQRRVEERLGAGFLSPGHLETVYRTNLASAFSIGQETVMADPIARETLPFARYDSIRDARARATHLALETLGLDGTNVYWASDPFWLSFSPPWEFNCRCSKTFLTVRQAARLGVKAAQQWLDTGVEPRFKEYRLAAIDFRPPVGFVGPRVLA